MTETKLFKKDMIIDTILGLAPTKFVNGIFKGRILSYISSFFPLIAYDTLQ